MIALPTARLLLTIRNRKWTVHEALAELIDNSFGERRGRASCVWIRWSPKTRVLTVLDNGQGMRDVADLFTLGQGTTSGAGDIGFYGVGGSEALLWLADYAEVTTLRKGRLACGKADWKRCIDRVEFPDINNRWREATLATCPLALQELEQGAGTLIRLRIRSGLQIHAEVIQERLSRLFAVAFRNRRHITWSTLDPQVVESPLAAWSPGEFEDVHRATVTLENGLSAAVTVGRVANLSIANSKLSVNYIYRQITETTAGFGRPVQGACGYIDLSSEWLPYLTTTKDGINEEGREFETALMKKIAEALKPLVDQLAKAKRTRLFTNLKIQLNQKFDYGFKVLADRTRETPPDEEDEEVGRGDDLEDEPPRRRRRRRHHNIQAMNIDIEDATNQATGGNLCQAILEDGTIRAFVNVEHPQIIEALEAEPLNQKLLESHLITALSKQIVEQNAIVKIGLLSQRDADALYERYQDNAWDVLLHVVRLLTDGVESMAGVEKPTAWPDLHP